MRSPELKDVPVELRPMDPADLIFFDNPSDNPTKLSYVMHDAARQAAAAGLPPAYFLAMEQRLLEMASQLAGKGKKKKLKKGQNGRLPTYKWSTVRKK